MKWFKKKKTRGAARTKTLASMAMVNFVDPQTRKYILGVECPAVAEQAMRFYLSNKDEFGVTKTIKSLKTQPFVKEAKEKTKERQAKRRREQR